jgi:hypothetical protein
MWFDQFGCALVTFEGVASVRSGEQACLFPRYVDAQFRVGPLEIT